MHVSYTIYCNQFYIPTFSGLFSAISVTGEPRKVRNCRTARLVSTSEYGL